MHLRARHRSRANEAMNDRSTWSLIGANLFGAAIALLSGMTLRDLMLVYWLQSVIIGVSYLVRMLKAEDFQLFTPMCFVINYGLFHAIYFYFIVFGPLRDGTSPAAAALVGMLLCGLIFAGHEAYSTAGKLARDWLARPSLGNLAGTSFLRIVPMHLTIVFGGTLGSDAVSWLLFVGLKTVADVAMHVVEQQLARRSTRRTDRGGD